jgi:manganese transport protein
MPSHTMSRKTEKSASEVLEGKSRKGLLRRLLPFIGPAFIASIAYIDPGNFATNIQSGAQFGYILLWVIVASNLMAMLIQALSAKLGIATGRNLAELCAEKFPRPVSLGLWVGMELASMATDLAEFLGAAVGFNLLLGVPLWIAGFLTAIATFIILGLERFGFRPLEAVISAFVGVISVSYLVELLIVKPDWGAVLPHAVIPQFQGNESIILSVGILGATVMPHVIFLHSALTQNRIVGHGDAQKRRLFRYELVDVGVAMGVAGLVNGAMLVMAAGTFFQNGQHDVGTLEQAYKTLQPLLGNASGWLFGVALLASGLSSSSVGTQAGQVIMEGFIHRKIPVWLRRLITMVPSLVVILIGLDPTRTLVLSQVVLSFCLPMALIPLVIFTNHRDLMGALVNRAHTKILIILVTAIIIGLNIYLLYGVLAGTGG